MPDGLKWSLLTSLAPPPTSHLPPPPPPLLLLLLLLLLLSSFPMQTRQFSVLVRIESPSALGDPPESASDPQAIRHETGPQSSHKFRFNRLLISKSIFWSRRRKNRRGRRRRRRRSSIDYSASMQFVSWDSGQIVVVVVVLEVDGLIPS